MSIIGGINLGGLTDYLFFFGNGNDNAELKGSTTGFLGNIAIDGIIADEKTNGTLPYAGVMSTNDITLGPWQNIIDDNPTQSSAQLLQTILIPNLKIDLINAIKQINLLPVTPGFENSSPSSLNGLNTQNGIDEIFVINITSGLTFNDKINITGDAGDVFILRWDTDGDPSNGYQGQLNPGTGGAIVPHGGLKATNFISVAGDIKSNIGGSNPPLPYPQGPRYNDGTGSLILGGSDFSGGGFFTGYLLTTGKPTTFDPITGLYIGKSSALHDAIFVGGWYSLTTEFSLKNHSSGVYITPNPSTLSLPEIELKKYVSPNNGATWYDADVPPGPTISSNILPKFKFSVTNTGNTPISNVIITDDVYGLIGTIPSMLPGDTSETIITKPWQSGEHVNTSTAMANYGLDVVTSSDSSHYFGEEILDPSIKISKYVSLDNGLTWVISTSAPGPTIFSNITPQFQFVVTNTGNADLTNVIITDDLYGNISTIPLLLVGESDSFIISKPWEEGQHQNTVTATGEYGIDTVTDQISLFYFGELAEPAIKITKYVSGDNGVTFEDANTPPGPTIFSDVFPKFKIVVENIGNVDLTNVIVTDTSYGIIGILPILNVSEVFEWVLTKPWEYGLNENIATVTANFDTVILTLSDNAFYTGQYAPVPQINIVKYVSVDNGVTWIDANNLPGPLLKPGFTIMFKYIVTNTGDTELTNITLTDDVLGLLTTVPFLNSGDFFEFFI